MSGVEEREKGGQETGEGRGRACVCGVERGVGWVCGGVGGGGRGEGGEERERGEGGKGEVGRGRKDTRNVRANGCE